MKKNKDHKDYYFSKLITNWYLKNKRDLPWRNTSDPYKIWLSEVILQQTRVEQGLPYYEKFISKFPSVHILAKASEQSVLKEWQGLGYYSRARNLHATSKTISKTLKGKFPDSYSELLKLKGIGKYTAAAIASFAYNEPKAVVDGNVYRVLSRYFGISTPIDSTLGKNTFEKLAQSLITNKKPDLHNQAIMEMGAVICTKHKPQCSNCVLQISCFAFENNCAASFPVKSKKNKIKERYFHYFLITYKNQIWLSKRLQNDIWKGLFEFPLLETKSNAYALNTFLKKIKINPETILLKNKVKTSTHKLSHQTIYLNYSILQLTSDIKSKTFKKITLSNLKKYPFPQPLARFLQKHFPH